VLTARRTTVHDAPRARTGERQAGWVTAETATVLPVLFVVLGAVLYVLACAGAQLRCTDAAALAARAAARGDSAEQVRQTARAAAPAGAVVDVRYRAEQVEVVVSARVRPMTGPLSALPAPRVQGRAVAADERAVGP
jgi:Flp pilus assembly protein TadG